VAVNGHAALSACNGVAPVTSAAAKTLRLGGELCLAGSNSRGQEASGALNQNRIFDPSRMSLTFLASSAAVYGFLSQALAPGRSRAIAGSA
jgi:hypothetical protein